MGEAAATKRLTRIQVRGYKSIREMDLELGQINVLIGGNGAGKSNFVSLFQLLRAKMVDELDEYVARSGGANSLLYYGAKKTPAMRVDLSLESATRPYTLELTAGARDMIIATTELDILVPNPVTDESQSIVALCQLYQFNDTSASSRIRATSYIRNNRVLMSDGGNLAAFLYMLQETQGEYYRRIVDTIRDVAPHFGDFDLAPDKLNPDSILLNWREAGSEYLFGPHQLPDGLLRFMALATLLLQPNDTLPGIVIIDEPELGLHPYAINVLGGLVRKAATHCQLVLATQSVNLLDQFEPEHVVTVERHRVDGQYESVFRRVDPGELAEWLAEYSLSELWEKNVIGGRPTR
ncbi:AAA family ATPase [bacterium]|nr:AAA family ATPase [bacterium]